MSDSSDLGGSFYELVNTTDTDSHYTSDAEGPRMDDVQSLGESEHLYGSDSEEEDEEEEDEHARPTPHDTSIRYADQLLRNPSTTLPIDNLQLGVSQTTDGPSSSIEFQEMEVDPQDRDNIAVMHTVREFSEEDTKLIAENMHIQEPPKGLAATIRQTMLENCLETPEALRIFYAGDLAAEREILSKISSAIYASNDGCANTEEMYNIHQMDNFMSSETPNVEMFPLSPYSIKVDRCKSAEVFPDGDTRMCSITLDKNRTYTTFSESESKPIEPAWSLPHIAIFYCTEVDDDSVKTTRYAASKFMTTWGVPSIFISDAQSFTRPVPRWWREDMDPRAIHMCLESRDPEKPTEPYRLPIDVASFLNIDARQMNRNLACLTGLGRRKDLVYKSDAQLELLEKAGKKLKSLGFPSRSKIEQVAAGRWFATIVVPLLLSILAPYILGPIFQTAVNTGAGETGRHMAMTSVSTPTTTTKMVFTTTTTVLVDINTTKPTQVSQVEPSASSLASSALSYAGLISGPSSVTEPESKKTACSVEMQPSKHEILVKLPPGSKAAWLAKGAIDIDVRRGEELLKSRLSSTDEGILVEINKRDAWGVLNVSVVTTRRPKINQTFEINYGRPVVMKAVDASLQLLQDVVKEVASTANKAAHTAEDSAAASWETLRDRTMSLMDNVFGAARSAQHFGSLVASDAVTRVKHSMIIHDLTEVFDSAYEQFLSAEEDLDVGVLQAQIASKLWWLKVQGKEKEYEEYNRKATAYVMSKKADLQQARKVREKEAGAQNKKSCGSKDSRKCRRGSKQEGSHNLREWRKIITG